MFDPLLRWIAALNGSETETEQPEQPEEPFYMGADWDEKREEAQARARFEWEMQ